MTTSSLHTPATDSFDDMDHLLRKMGAKIEEFEGLNAELAVIYSPRARLARAWRRLRRRG